MKGTVLRSVTHTLREKSYQRGPTKSGVWSLGEMSEISTRAATSWRALLPIGSMALNMLWRVAAAPQ
jgi:hypothetical protein